VTIQDGQVVTLEYTVRFDDGRLIDSTGECGPLAIMVGSGQLFPALEDRILDMAVGETREIRIPPEDAYGAWNPALVRSIPRDRLSADLEIEVGGEYGIKGPDGRRVRFRVEAFDDREVRGDFNDRHAGKTLVATVTMVAVRAPTPDEERRGRV